MAYPPHSISSQKPLTISRVMGFKIVYSYCWRMQVISSNSVSICHVNVQFPSTCTSWTPSSSKSLPKPPSISWLVLGFQWGVHHTQEMHRNPNECKVAVKNSRNKNLNFGENVTRTNSGDSRNHPNLMGYLNTQVLDSLHPQMENARDLKQF